jgi:hypothetical protein
MMEEEIFCDFCREECTYAHSTCQLEGAETAHQFCRGCLDVSLSADEQKVVVKQLIKRLIYEAHGEPLYLQ